MSDKALHVDAVTGAVIENPPRVMLYLHPDDPHPTPGTQYRVTFNPAGPVPSRTWPRKNSNEAAILSKDHAFHRYLTHNIANYLMTDNDEDRAARFIRIFCGVGSRAGLDTDVQAAQIFVSIYESFQRWLAEQQHVQSSEERPPADPGSQPTTERS